MLQILIWGICALIFGLGFCAMSIEKIAAGKEKTPNTGLGIFIFMIILAILIFVLSLFQGQNVSSILDKIWNK